MSVTKHGPQLRAIPSPERSTSIKARESWHILGIVSEFVEATERLADIRPAVSIFGSARIVSPPMTVLFVRTISQSFARSITWDAGVRS